MKTEFNCAGGDTVFVSAKEALTDVPKTHQSLLTSEIRQVFARPGEYFSAVADRCPFPMMQKYLRKWVQAKRWRLCLHENDYGYPGTATFVFDLRAGIAVEVSLPTSESAANGVTFPDDVKTFYSLVGSVRWAPYGCGGGAYGFADIDPLTKYGPLQPEQSDPSRTFCWGSSGGGDQLIFSTSGRGGWWCHETGDIHWLGSFGEALDWVFAELLAKREPDFNYEWLKLSS